MASPYRSLIMAKCIGSTTSGARSESPANGGTGGGRPAIISTFWMPPATGIGSSASRNRGGGFCTGYSSDGGNSLCPKWPIPNIVPSFRRQLRRGTSSYPYAELDVTTNFSFLRGASHPDELVYRAAELGHTAIAVTDINSVAGVVRAHQAAKEAGIKLCVGASALRRCARSSGLGENREGYANLCRLLTTGKRRAEKGSCILHLADLLASPTGLLAALVCQSIDPQVSEPDPAAIDAAARALKDAFGRGLSIAARVCMARRTD